MLARKSILSVSTNPPPKLSLNTPPLPRSTYRYSSFAVHLEANIASIPTPIVPPTRVVVPEPTGPLARTSPSEPYNEPQAKPPVTYGKRLYQGRPMRPRKVPSDCRFDEQDGGAPPQVPKNGFVPIVEPLYWSRNNRPRARPPTDWTRAPTD